MSSTFVQLSQDDCYYLLQLIEEMDSSTPYTEKQRSYTVPKLNELYADPNSRRLAHQDIAYLLELIEDDNAPECEQQREMTRSQLLLIQELQQRTLLQFRSRSSQRAARKDKRIGVRPEVQA